MGYTRIIKSGEQIEIYKYEKEYVHTNKRNYKKNTRRASFPSGSDHDVPTRTKRSMQRAKQLFIRLVASNLQGQAKPAFLTLTIEKKVSLEVGYAYLRSFWNRLKKHIHGISYIGVPEWQERGALHFHFLVWGLPTKTIKSERFARNVQRQWYRGFVDLRHTKNRSLGLAHYLAKYLVSTLSDSRLGNRRAYTCSRNILRPYTIASNKLPNNLDLTPGDNFQTDTSTYDTLWLGSCEYTRYYQGGIN